jgi:hypothetical protein
MERNPFEWCMWVAAASRGLDPWEAAKVWEDNLHPGGYCTRGEARCRWCWIQNEIDEVMYRGAFAREAS